MFNLDEIAKKIASKINIPLLPEKLEIKLIKMVLEILFSLLLEELEKQELEKTKRR